MTCVEFVRCFWGPISERECEDLLWQTTPFPCAEPKYIAQMLRRAYRASRGEVGLALALADREISRQMSDLNRREELADLRHNIQSRMTPGGGAGQV